MSSSSDHQAQTDAEIPGTVTMDDEPLPQALRTWSVLRLLQGPFGAAEATLIGLDLCRALSAVHRAGVLHRDIKARNAMREDGGRIVLMDFGTGSTTRTIRTARRSSSQERCCTWPLRFWTGRRRVPDRTSTALAYFCTAS